MRATIAAGNPLDFPVVPAGEEWEVLSVAAYETSWPWTAITDMCLVLMHVDKDGNATPMALGLYGNDITSAAHGEHTVQYHPGRGVLILQGGERMQVRDMAGTQPALGGGMAVIRRTGAAIGGVAEVRV